MKNRLRKGIVVAAIVSLLGGPVGISWAAVRVMVCEDCGGGGNPTPSIRLLSHISTVNTYGTGYVYDMQLVGNKLYTANIYYDPVFDVSNPSSPYKLYEIEHYGSAAHWGIKVVGSKYYAVGTSLDVWDISGQPPVYLGGSGPITLDTQTDLDVANNKAYVVTDVDGQASGQSAVLSIWDVSNPANISRLAWEVWSEYPNIAPHPPNPTNVIVDGSYAYIGMQGLRIYDVSDATHPTFVSRLDARTFDSFQSVHKRDDTVKVGSTIFKAIKTIGVLVFDVRIIDQYDKPEAILTGVIGAPTIALGDVIALEVVGNRMIVATAQDKQLKILDISSQNNPTVLASTSISGIFDATAGTESLEVEVDPVRKLAFVAGETYLNIYDISDFLQ